MSDLRVYLSPTLSVGSCSVHRCADDSCLSRNRPVIVVHLGQLTVRLCPSHARELGIELSNLTNDRANRGVGR